MAMELYDFMNWRRSTLANMSNSSFWAQLMMCDWNGIGFNPNTLGSRIW